MIWKWFLKVRFKYLLSRLVSMSPILLLNKPVGMTPLDCIRDFVSKNPAYENVTLGYAGRLDPMAEGLLVVLVGDENKKRESYLGLDKEYEVEVLFGVGTDTYDVMGLIIQTGHKEVRRSDIERVMSVFEGDIVQEYPPYSSKTVHGKPLYAWAREDRLNEIQIPQEHRSIREILCRDVKKIPFQDAEKIIEDRLDSVVSGDFRVPEIREAWKNYFAQMQSDVCMSVASLTVACSSGTYMRTLAHEIGKAVGTCAIALSIKRTRVGDFQLSSADR